VVPAAKVKDVRLTTQAEAAEWFGVAFGTMVRNWRPNGMPWDDDGGSAQAIGRWLARRLGQRHAGSTEEAANKRDAEARKLLADARLKELTYDRLAGNLVPLDAVRLEISEALTRFRDRVMRIPEELRPTMPREWVEQIVGEVENRLRLALGALANSWEQLEDSLAESEEEQAPEDE
jgi:hypothetical protein